MQKHTPVGALRTVLGKKTLLLPQKRTPSEQMLGVYGVVASTQASRDWAAGVSGMGCPPRLGLYDFQIQIALRSRDGLARQGLTASGPLTVRSQLRNAQDRRQLSARTDSG